MKIVFKTLIIVTVVFSLFGQDSARKRKEYNSPQSVGAGSSKVGNEIAEGLTTRRKRAHLFRGDGRMIGFHLKGKKGFNHPYLRLTDFSNIAGEGVDRTYEGSDECDKGGTITISNMIVKDYKESETDTTYMETFNMKGNVSFQSCKDGGTDYFAKDNVPDYYDEVYNSSGYITVSGKQGFGFKLITLKSGDQIDLEVTDSNIKIVANKNSGFTYNNSPVQSMDISIKSNLEEWESEPKSIGDKSYEITRYLNGTVTVTGTINGKAINEKKTYKNKIFKYRFENCTDEDNEYDDCDYKESEE